MRRNTTLVVAIVFGLSLAAPVATLDAQGRGAGRGQAAKADKPDKRHSKPDKQATDKPQRQEKQAQKPAKKGDTAVFDRDGHARVIRQYRVEGLPPGLAKRETLPPGLAKQLRERGELPPGLEQHLVAVPDPLSARLPALPSHHRRYFVGDDLVVVDTQTNRVVAIIRNVLR